jgi:hypothetical protein
LDVESNIRELQEHHVTGPSWNPAGGEAKLGAAAPVAAAPVAATPKVAAAPKAAEPSAASDTKGALFASLGKVSMGWGVRLGCLGCLICGEGFFVIFLCVRLF